MNWLLNFILSKSQFPHVENAHLELKKAAILRIFLGIIIFARFAEIAYSHNLYYESETVFYWSVYILTLIFLFTIGLLTPIVTILLFASLRLYDVAAGTSNLGTIILINTLLVLILINHGYYYSVDNLILKGQGFISRAFKKIYQLFGTPSEGDITKAYLTGFIIYALISFGALLYHLTDDYWRDGVTVKSLLTNSYLGKQYGFFRWFEASFPTLMGVFSISGGILQSIFQFLMIPLIFLRLGKWFVILWGLNFILSSLFFINLSYLPHVELIFWSLIFFPINIHLEKLEIIFDDHCDRCRRTISFLQMINFNGRYVFIPLSERPDGLPGGSDGLTGKTHISASYRGKTFSGYDVYLKATSLNPLLWIPALLFYLGKLLKVGPQLYNFLANRRDRSSGKLEHSFKNEIGVKVFNDHYRRSFLNVFYNIYGLLLIPFIFLVFPLLNQKVIDVFFKDSSFPTDFKYAVEKIGLHIPGVFNRVDLSMGNHWLVLYKQNGEKWDLVPLTATDGSRLNYNGFDILYFSNHNSDVLYFGCTLGYRRDVLDKTDLVQYHESSDWGGRQHIEMITRYDYKYNAHQEPVKYRVEVYGSTSSETEVFVSDQNRHHPTLLYSKSFLFDGEKLSSL